MLLYGVVGSDDDAPTARALLVWHHLSSHGPSSIRRLRGARVERKDLKLELSEERTSLHAVIRASALQLPVHAQYVTWQLLEALEFSHLCGVVHCRVSPSAVSVVDEECHVALGDWMGAHRSGETTLFWPHSHKAPELMIGVNNAQPSQDMWSLGCLVYEMYAGRAAFLGTGVLQLASEMVALLGEPSADDLENMGTPHAVHVLAGPLPPPVRQRELLEEMGGDEVAADFVRQLLQLDPGKRMTASEALLHPYVEQFVGGEPRLAPVPVPEAGQDSIHELLARLWVNEAES